MRFGPSAGIFGTVWMRTGDFAGDADGTGGFETSLGPDCGSVEGIGGNNFDLCRGDCVGAISVFLPCATW